jgi:hypothetical protein
MAGGDGSIGDGAEINQTHQCDREYVLQPRIPKAKETIPAIAAPNRR